MTTRKFKQTKNTNYFSIVAIVLLIGVLITSCKEEFNEELLFSQQERVDELAQQEADAEAAQEAANAAALAAAQLLDYTVTLHSDDVPAEGVAVNLTNNAGTTVSVTTDTDGNAIFTGLAMGGHTVSMSSVDYLDASYNVDFGTPVAGVHYEIIDGKVLSLGINAESSKVELFSLSGLNTATIQGKVEIETDLTNSTPEVPQDITIRANLDGIATVANSHSFIDDDGFGQNSTSIYVPGSFTLTEGDIGIATVDNATGDYTMRVPATDDGADIELLFPLVEADQTIGFSSVNGQDVGTQIGTQAALFGPDIDATETPSIAGVVAEFTYPEPGRGFNVTSFTRYANDIVPIGPSFVSIDEFPVKDFNDVIRYRGAQGSGYQFPPAVTVSAPDLTEGVLPANATIEAWMSWTLESVEYAAQPALTYNANEPITISVEISDEDGVQDVYELAQINAGLVGQLDAGSVNVDSALLMAPDGGNVINTNYVVTSFNIVFTGNQANNPSGTLARSGSVNIFRITQDGRGYLEIPTIDVEAAPEGGTNATLEITDMAFQYMFDMDNTNVTQPYVILPEIDFEYQSSPEGSTDITDEVRLVTLGDDGFVDILSFNDHEIGSVIVASNGQVLFDDDSFFFEFGGTPIDMARLVEFSYATPRAIIVEPTHEQTTADVVVNEDGEITGLANITHGIGYNSTYDVQFTTLSNLPGSGATMGLTGFSVTDDQTGEVTWSEDYILTNGGSGYTLDVNIDKEPFTPAITSQVITIKNGETKIVNINYGTGTTVADVD